MSGGSFDYNNYQLDALADDIERVVKRNHTKDDWGFCNNFTPETIEKLENTSNQLRILSKKVHRIDWLVASDDSEETFHERWQKEGLT